MSLLSERRDSRQAELQGLVDQYNEKQKELGLLADEIKAVNGAVKELIEQVKDEEAAAGGEACPA